MNSKRFICTHKSHLLSYSYLFLLLPPVFLLFPVSHCKTCKQSWSHMLWHWYSTLHVLQPGCIWVHLWWRFLLFTHSQFPSHPLLFSPFFESFLRDSTLTSSLTRLSFFVQVLLLRKPLLIHCMTHAMKASTSTIHFVKKTNNVFKLGLQLTRKHRQVRETDLNKPSPANCVNQKLNQTKANIPLTQRKLFVNLLSWHM